MLRTLTATAHHAPNIAIIIMIASLYFYSSNLLLLFSCYSGISYGHVVVVTPVVENQRDMQWKMGWASNLQVFVGSLTRHPQHPVSGIPQEKTLMKEAGTILCRCRATSQWPPTPDVLDSLNPKP